MSLATPKTIRTLQRKLYRKAKAEPAFRFYLLYDKIYRADILRHAYALEHEEDGCAQRRLSALLARIAELARQRAQDQVRHHD
jgi:hypothetical protein